MMDKNDHHSPGHLVRETNQQSFSMIRQCSVWPRWPAHELADTVCRCMWLPRTRFTWNPQAGNKQHIASTGAATMCSRPHNQAVKLCRGSSTYPLRKLLKSVAPSAWP